MDEIIISRSDMLISMPMRLQYSHLENLVGFSPPVPSEPPLFPWANSLCFWFCGVLWYLTTRTTATATQLRQLSSTTTTTNYSVRPPAHNPYYVTSHTAAVQAAVAAAMPPGPAASTAGPFVDIVGHQAHQQAQSAIAVPVMPPGAGRSLHYHTHAATHALPHQQSPLTYPNWVPFSHFN